MISLKWILFVSENELEYTEDLSSWRPKFVTHRGQEIGSILKIYMVKFVREVEKKRKKAKLTHFAFSRDSNSTCSNLVFCSSASIMIASVTLTPTMMTPVTAS